MRSLRTLTSILALALLASLAPLAAQEPEIEAAKPPSGYPVQPGVWQLPHGNDPTRPLDDLEPLRALIGKASVVGLGETIHTSGGYYRMKHRVFRFLVEKMGFRVFAFESPWENAEKVARYVASCSGSAGDAVSQGLFGVWASEEVRDLAQWMCDWNRTHPKPKDRLYFFGFDIQQPETDGPALIAFLARIGIPGNDPAADGIRQCEGVERDWYPQPIPEEVHTRCMDALAWIETHFARNAKAIVRQTSKADFEWAKVRLVGLRGWEYQMWYPDSRSYTGRDEAMAYAFQVIRKLRHPRAKIAVWAHNSHVSHAPHPLNGGIPMGMFLTRALGRSYVNLGLAAREVSIDWASLGCGPQPLGPNPAEEVFHGVGQGDLLIDLDAPLLEPGAVYTLGARRMVPREHFDGLLYLEQSPKMTPLKWEPCR
ncbi:MAG TPA: erythromycin esterase family protein [Thermoanaerobaculia bacterium]|nr:erythromycin esterase family protein [Thermoanaerobaculia bacterium]